MSAVPGARGFLMILVVVALLALPAPALGAASSSAYNPQSVNKCEVTVTPRYSTSAVRDIFSNQIGNLQIGPTQLNVQTLDTVAAGSSGNHLYYFQGAKDPGTPKRSFNGHVFDYQLEDPPPVRPNDRCRKGAGAAAPLNGRNVILDPKPIPTSLRFSEQDRAWNTYTEYGRLGPAPGNKYLVWTWVSNDAPSGACGAAQAVSHGGYARGILPPNTRFYEADVQTVDCQDYTGTDDPCTSDPEDPCRPNDGVNNGRVEAMYGRINNGRQDIWGWTVRSHTVDGVKVNHYR